MKRRAFIPGEGETGHDKYPEIDQYIPDAVIIANRGFDKETNRWEWDGAFLAAMDEILSEKGLRVIPGKKACG